MNGTTRYPEDIRTRLDRIERLLVSLLSRKSRRKPPPEYIPVREAAVVAGKTLCGLQTALRRERQDPDGMHIRRIHGAVNRADLMRWLETKAKRNPGLGQEIRDALEDFDL
ncbi:hypothetical protein HQ520_03915 [bacterium]|nr:hypothetical protein [bacterium]